MTGYERSLVGELWYTHVAVVPHSGLHHVQPVSQSRLDPFIAVCSCLYQATVSQKRYRGGRTDWVWYSHVQTALGCCTRCLEAAGSAAP
jgi:hypothetical protein